MPIQPPDPIPTAVAPQPFVILAAGRSSRMGRPKPLLPWRGRTFLQHVCAAARSGGGDPLLVVAADPDQLAAATGPLGPVHWVACPEADEGQAASLRTGLRAALALRPGCQAVLIGLADQVGLEPRAVEVVLAAVARGGADAWVAAYSDAPEVPGHPVALGPAVWPQVLALRGDQGARPLLAGLAHRLCSVPLPAAWRPQDCDTPADYAALLAADAAPRTGSAGPA